MVPANSQIESKKLWDSLVELSGRFLRATCNDEILDELASHLRKYLGFPHLVVYEFKANREPAQAVLWKVRGDHPTVASVPVDGDLILTEVLASTEPIVVEDATTDPRTNKEVVAAKGCRTLVFLPMRLADGSRMFVSTGTFGEQSWSPNAASRDYLATLGYHTGLALDRMRIYEEQQLLNAEVSHAEKMELLGRVAGSGAHELRNLLTSISGYTALIQELLEGESEAAELAPKIERAAARATEVVKQLLAFSRRGRGAGGTLDLSQVITDLESMLASLLGDEVRFTLQLEQDLRPVSLSKSQLEQLLVHLVANAAEALGDRGEVTIKTSNTGARFAHQDDGDWVSLSITDDGPGLLPEVAARVFDPFFSTRAPANHPGLGLSTCYGIVHQAGGQISINTAPGKGTTVNVRFPAVGSPRPAASEIEVEALPKPGKADGFSGALVNLARKLLKATDFSEVVDAARREIQANMGLNAVFLYLARGNPPNAVELWLAQGQDLLIPQTLPADHSQLIKDALIAQEPIVVLDSRTDPRTNKKTVAQSGTVSLVILPFTLADGRQGGLGTGTFGEEGVRPVTDTEVEFLVALTNLTVVALDRLRMLEVRWSAQKRFLRGQHLEAVSRLGRGLADDLRNALTAIDGFTHLAQVSLDDQHTAQPTLQKIVDSSKKAADLVDKLVAFAGPERVTPTVFDLNKLAHSLRPLLQHLAKGRRLEVVTSEHPCELAGDWGQLEQVILNLAFNAIEATPEQGKVSLSTSCDQKNAQLTVSDNGQGMSEEVVSMAFEPFFTTKPPTLGTGLGLPTCKRIVNQAGGSISVASQPGEGTVVTVQLPLVGAATK